MMADDDSNIPTQLITRVDTSRSGMAGVLTYSRAKAMFDIGSSGSYDSVPASPQELHGVFPGYEVLGVLGCGGMSTVYRVRDEELGREVALKMLRPELTKEELALEMFVNEARITAQLDHPNIPAVYALTPKKDRFRVFTMKVLEGQTLESVLLANERENRDGLSAALEILLRICDALAFAHSKGVLHLDLKPSNVIVGAFGQIYLVDWGIAQRRAHLQKDPAGPRTVEGTPAYMAPEQASGEQWKFDERTDVFALGGILYRILCGRPPHAAQTTDQSLTLAANASVTPPEELAAEKGRTLPRRLVSICMTAMAADPEARYQRVEDFQQDLERYLRGLAQLPQRSYTAGQAIISEGDPGDAAYVIISGECVATRVVRGTRQELRRMKAGEMFGEAAVFTGQPRSATVSAVTDTVVGVVDKAALREEMERTSFMSLAIRTVTSTFLDLDRQLTRQRQQSHAIELALRYIALHGDCGRALWAPLLAHLVRSTGSNEADVSAWVLGAERVALDGDYLVLLG